MTLDEYQREARKAVKVSRSIREWQEAIHALARSKCMDCGEEWRDG